MSQVCNDFLNGRCFRPTCRFSHDGAPAAGGYGAPPAYGGYGGCVHTPFVARRTGPTCRA
jgi:hypothetical protein